MTLTEYLENHLLGTKTFSAGLVIPHWQSDYSGLLSECSSYPKGVQIGQVRTNMEQKHANLELNFANSKLLWTSLGPIWAKLNIVEANLRG